MIEEMVNLAFTAIVIIAITGVAVIVAVLVWKIIGVLTQPKQKPTVPQTARERVINRALVNKRAGITRLAWVGDDNSTYYEFANYDGHIKCVFPTVEVTYKKDKDGKFLYKKTQTGGKELIVDKKVKKSAIRYFFIYRKPGPIGWFFPTWAPPLLVPESKLASKTLKGVIRIMADSTYPLGEFDMIATPGVKPDMEGRLAHQIYTDSTLVDDVFSTSVERIKTVIEGEPTILSDIMRKERGIVPDMRQWLKGGK